MAKKLRILMLNYEFPPLGGGASPVSYELAKGYVKLGHSVDVVTMGFKDLPKYEVKDGIHIYRVPCMRSKKEICHPWEQYSYLRAAKRFLREHMKTHSYDINHTHFIIPTGVLALWVKRNYGVPYIITSHGSDVPGFNNDRFKFLHLFTGPFLRKICSEAKVITTPSVYLAELIRSKIGDYNVVPIPNGSRDFILSRVRKEKIIVSSGRLLERKGFQYLISAFNDLNPVGWRLYIIGDGPYRKKLVKISNKNKNILFTGWINNDSPKYFSLMNKATIFSLLSERESQGIVYLEAMSCKCAILSSDISASKETVSKDIGLLVNPRDSESVKLALKKLIYNSDFTAKCMKNSRRRYEALYRYEKIVKRYEGVLM